MTNNYITQIISAINNYPIDVDACPAFSPDVAKSPLSSKKAYVSVEKIGDNFVDAKISIYCPMNQGGAGCQQIAENISNIINNDFDFEIQNLIVGGVSYSRDDLAYKCCITFTIKEYPDRIVANNFSERVGVTVTFAVGGYDIARDFSIKPIMSIFEDYPVGVSDSRNKYSIILHDAPVYYINELANYGTFDLRVGNYNFRQCCCVKSTEKESQKAEIFISGFDDVPIIGGVPELNF